MARYSGEMKESIVAKMCMPGGPSTSQLSKETGISYVSLLNWKRAYSGEDMPKKERSPENWSTTEKFQAVLECQNLSEEKFGEYLRSKGLYSHHIDLWKSEFLQDAKSKNKVGRPKLNPEVVKFREEIKDLKRDLNRKNRALAEQTALVILQKKFHNRWKDQEEDEF